MLDEAEAAVAVEIFGLEAAPQALGRKLHALAVGNGLHRLGEFDLQAARQFDAVLRFQDIGNAALAAIAN